MKSINDYKTLIIIVCIQLYVTFTRKKQDPKCNSKPGSVNFCMCLCVSFGSFESGPIYHVPNSQIPFSLNNR